jgi:aspartate carbamoyltransferase catalytic subunit
VPMPAPGMELPAHVDQRLREEFHCTLRPGLGSIGAVYRTPDDSHQPALFTEPDFEVRVTTSGSRGHEKIAAVYVTRFQKERWADKERPYLKIDSEFLKERKYAQASVLHPLPRVGEIDVALDDDARAVYFEQAAYGVPVRMALISLLLGLNGKSLDKFHGGFRKTALPLYEQPLNLGLKCSNGNCIVKEETEEQYVRNKFYIVNRDNKVRLRCVYCETDIEHFVVANKKNKWFTRDPSVLIEPANHSSKELVAFESDSAAIAAGFHSRRKTSEPIQRRDKAAQG